MLTLLLGACFSTTSAPSPVGPAPGTSAAAPVEPRDDTGHSPTLRLDDTGHSPTLRPDLVPENTSPPG